MQPLKPFASFWIAAVGVSLTLSLSCSGQVQSVYPLGVSLDGVPGRLTRTEDGSFYGVLNAGGRRGVGSIFHLSADGASRTTVFDFGNASTNDTVNAGIIVGITNGFIYGIFTDFPSSGGTNLLYRVGTNGTGFTALRGLPALYSAIVLASDQRFYLIHSSQLDRFEIDGTGLVLLTNGLDLTRLFEGPDGLFYGSSSTALRRLNKDASQITTLTNTSRSIVSLVLGDDGHLYGTTDNFPNGEIAFRVGADGTGFQTLGNLDSGGQDSSVGALLDGGDGKLYATFNVGPQAPATRILAIDKAGGVTTVTNLPASYDASSGQLLTLGQNGRLFGVSSQGGANGAGVIYSVSRAGGGLLEHFQFGGVPGALVQSALWLGVDGRLYGTASQGGLGNRGMVFALNQDGTGFTVLKQFASAAEGIRPRGGIVQGADGVLYGTTEQGGTNGGGTVFRLAPDGSQFLTIAHLNQASGTNPVAQLLLASDGLLYGSCFNGGTTATNGTVWKVQTNGAAFTVLRAFAATGSEGRRPFARLTEGADGMIYGTTDTGGSANKGVIFKMAKDGSSYGVMRNLLGFGEPANPEGRLLQLADGTLIGTAAAGGSAGLGCLFQIQTNGTAYRVVHSFGSTNSDARVPVGGLLQDRDGSLIGTTRFGGGQAAGTVYRINPDGSGYQILYRFSTNYPSALEPWASLTLNPASGSVFGVTTLGGPAFGGVIFRLESGTAASLILNLQKVGSAWELTWPGSGAGLQPQFNTDLSNRNGWQAAPGTPVLTNGFYKLSLVPSSGSAFYRLGKP